jgi:hypothetical protein
MAWESIRRRLSETALPCTEWQDGWNARGSALLEKIIVLRDWHAALPDDVRGIADEMIEDDALLLDEHDGTVEMHFDTSDLFDWGYSDAEKITDHDMLREAHRHWKADPAWGLLKWQCQREGRRPQQPVEKSMRESGAWDESMEAIEA